MIEGIQVNLRARKVVVGSVVEQTVLPITDMINCRGELTDDYRAAMAVVAGPDAAGQWLSIELSDLDDMGDLIE